MNPDRAYNLGVTAASCRGRIAGWIKEITAMPPITEDDIDAVIPRPPAESLDMEYPGL